MLPKKTTLLIFLMLFCAPTQLPATLTFTQTFNMALDYWGVGFVGAALGVAGCVLRCAVKCCCMRRRAKQIKRNLSEFKAQELLTGMAKIVKENLDMSSDSPAFIFKGTRATDLSWYVISGTEQTRFLARTLSNPGSRLDTSIRGLVIIGASFDNPLLADHSEHSDVSTNSLSVIANRCIADKVPLLIIYLGQDKHNRQYLPAFELAILTIPSTESLFDDPRSRLREHHALTVEALLENFGHAIAAKARSFATHRRNTDLYPSEKFCQSESNCFIESLRNYEEDEVAVTVAPEA